MDSLISIVIPVYNHEEAFQKTLDSIAQQTYKNFEVIIVDDGSDRELQITNHESRLPCRIIRQSHGGAPAARNRGLQEVKGDFIIFWDADVIAEPEMLQKMKAMLEAHPEASYAYSNLYFGRKKMPGRVFDAEALKKNNYIHTTSLIRRSAAIPWDELLERFQDWDMWLTMAEQGKQGVWIPEYLYRVIPHRGGISFWLPSFAYQAPWRSLPWLKGRAVAYETARDIVIKKTRRTIPKT